MIPQVRKKINIDHQNFSFTQNTMLSEENNMTVINNIANRQNGRPTNIHVPFIYNNNDLTHRSYENKKSDEDKIQYLNNFWDYILY